MRILHLVNDVTNRGNGIVNCAVDIAIEQVRQGHTVAIASAGGEYEPLLTAHGVKHIRLTQERSAEGMAVAMLRFPRVVRGFHPAVVHAHMRMGVLLASLWRRMLGYGLVSHLHNVHESESKMMGLAQRVIVVSKAVGEAAANDFGIARAKIRVVLNGTLGTPRLPEIATLVPAALPRPSIVTICGLYERKGIAELLTAFAMVAETVPEAHLIIVGDGPDAGTFHAQAKALPCADRIRFEGFQSNVQAYLLATDVFTLAARREAFGLVLIEARGAGCAIVATNVDGIPEVLDGGEAGILVPPQQPQILAETLLMLLTYPQQRAHWAQRAQMGLAAFHIEHMVNQVNLVYLELLKN